MVVFGKNEEEGLHKSLSKEDFEFLRRVKQEVGAVIICSGDVVLEEPREGDRPLV